MSKPAHRWFALVCIVLASCWGVAHAAPCPPDVRVPVVFRLLEPACAGKPVNVVVSACSPCVDLLDVTEPPQGPFQIRARMNLPACIVETLCSPDSLLIPLGTLLTGHYQIAAVVHAEVTSADSSVCTVDQDESFQFDVGPECPGPAPLPFVDTLAVGPPPPCPGCPPPPICDADSIPFLIGGHFPTTCFEFRGIQLLPSPVASPLPQPPIVRVLFALTSCLGRPCSDLLIPWMASVNLPPLPPSAYSLIVEVAEVSACDSLPTPVVTTTTVPFTVDACARPPCSISGWHHDPNSQCDGSVDAGASAKLLFQVGSEVPLAGLQGRFVLDPPALRITGLRAVGDAAGMQLAWEPRSDGAQFVLISKQGAPIHGCSPIIVAPCAPEPVLEVTAEALPGQPAPARTRLFAADLVASDSSGSEVPPCPGLLLDQATICSTVRCDMNGDGSADVRDLVLMVRCIRGVGACADSSLDCNQDGRHDLRDVVCCAHVILHGHVPAGTPRRQVPEVRVVVGEPHSTANGVDVPVRLERADLVGSARIDFAVVPGYTFANVTSSDASDWLHLEDDADAGLTLGLIALDPAARAQTVDLVVHYTRGGPGALGALEAAPSPTLRLVSTEFAGRDGVPLLTSQTAAAPVGGSQPFDLSAPRPNPFSGRAQFDVRTSSASDVEVGIFDLSGRLVRGLFHGRLEPGARSFEWDAGTDDGSRARDGIYFCRVTGAGVSLSRTLVLLRGH